MGPKEILNEVDDLLSRLEDYVHGKDGDDITVMRRKIRECVGATVSLEEMSGGGCVCQSCNLPYKIDILIQDELWELISPKQVDGYKGGGLLCGSCIIKRLEKILGYNYFNLTKLTGSPNNDVAMEESLLILLNESIKEYNPKKRFGKGYKQCMEDVVRFTTVLHQRGGNPD